MQGVYVGEVYDHHDLFMKGLEGSRPVCTCLPEAA